MHISSFPFTSVREDTHKKSDFFSGRTTKGVGRVTSRKPLSKNPLFFYKSGFFSTKIGAKKKLSKSVSGYYKILKKSVMDH